MFFTLKVNIPRILEKLIQTYGRFYSQVSVIIADWSKAATYCLTYKSSISNYSCHFYLVTRDNLANFNLQINNITSRTHINMQQHFNQSTGKSVYIENSFNFFGKYRKFMQYLFLK